MYPDSQELYASLGILLAGCMAVFGLTKLVLDLVAGTLL